MAAATLTITINIPKDIVEANLDEFPEKLDGLVPEVLQAVSKRLGPDAGAGVTLTSMTIT